MSIYGGGNYNYPYFVDENRKWKGNKIAPSNLLDFSDGNRFWRVTTGPTVEPVTVTEVKEYARIDGTSEDTYLGTLITSVRQAAEEYLGRALITQTMTMTFDAWVTNRIDFPRPRLISVTSVVTLDEDGTETTYSSDNYYVDTIAEPGALIVKKGKTPPTNTNRYVSGFKIVFTAGYGTTAADVPEGIKEGIKLWVAMVYENRVPMSKPPEIARTLLDTYRVLKI